MDEAGQVEAPTPEAIAFGDWIRQRRETLDLTRKNLAEAVGCAMVTITKIEHGERRPSRQVAERLAEALAIPPAEQALFVQWARGTTGAALPALPQPVMGPLVPTNLPASPTPFVGRADEVAAVRALLQRADVRLVTLLGPPGIGKTRLSQEVAAAMRDDFTHGVWWAELAPIQDPGLVATTIARALEVPEGNGAPAAERLRAFLQDKQLLLVLDNFEQVVAAAPLVGDLLAAAPRLKILVTSRVVLHLRWEQRFPVPPLALPDQEQVPDLAALAQVEAVTLFVARARAVQPNFTLTAANAPAVAAICARLEGLPLALELAAAWIRVLPPAALLARLESRLALLTQGAGDLLPHQQTLRDAIAWSYDLLAADEQARFRRLGVFVGGWTLEAAEAVVVPAEAGSPWAVLHGLTSLIDKSLVRQEAAGDEPRFTMLETIREYAGERLEASGEASAWRARHAEYYLLLAERAEPELKGPDQQLWLDRLDREQDNLRAAMMNAEAAGDAATALGLGTALWRFWWMRGYWREGAQLLDAALAAFPGAPPAVRAPALNGLGSLLHDLGDHDRAEALYRESIALQRARDDLRGVVSPLCNLGSLAWVRGDYVQAETLFRECLALYEALGDRWGISIALTNLGVTASARQDYFGARALQEQNLAIKRELGDKAGIAITLNNLGVLAMMLGDPATARAVFSESLALRRVLGDKLGVATALLNLGVVVGEQGDYATAYTLCREALEMRRVLGDKVGTAHLLEAYGRFAAAQGQASRAARCFGAADALRAAIGAPLPGAERPRHEQALAEARAQLPPIQWDLAWAEGTAMSLEQAIAYALAVSEA